MTRRSRGILPWLTDSKRIQGGIMLEPTHTYTPSADRYKVSFPTDAAATADYAFRPYL